MKKILLIGLVLMSLNSRSQSIGLDFMMSSKGSCQYGINVESLFKCFGVYANTLIKEDINADITWRHDGVTNYHGWIIGVSRDTGWDLFPIICIGAGKTKYIHYDYYVTDIISKPIFEVRSAIRLSKLNKRLSWIDLEFGINTEMQINTGVLIRCKL